MKLETERDVSEWVWSAKALAVVSAWTALGLFEQIARGPTPKRELPIDPRALATTLPVLLHLGLLSSDGDLLQLTETAKRLVAQRALPSARNLDTLRDLGRMQDVMREGGPVRDAQGKPQLTQGGTRADDLEHTERFLEMLYRMSEGAAESTFEWLSRFLPERGSVLDIGGGHGRYARAFADRGHTATLFDLPHVVELAKKRHGNVLGYLNGNFHEVEGFGGPYDMVLLCNIVHSESAEQNASLVARASKSLRSGGRLVIRDMFLDEIGRDPPHAVFFGLTMLFYTAHGQSPSLTHAREWMSAAGLADLRVTLLETQQLVMGKKP
jgi:2-polyprenyl-3-methyl-5-hydroxy-6-metoxy-1,4-benzoquinol methylase